MKTLLPAPRSPSWPSRDGRVRTYRAGAGNLATQAPIPRQPRVRIASNTKMFTATVVLQLVAEGRVDLDARVERYLPGLVRGHGNDGLRRATVATSRASRPATW